MEADIDALPKAVQSQQIAVRSIDGSPAVLIAEINGKEVGRMSITCLPLVHDMEIQPGMLQRKVADALFHYACGKVKAAGFQESLVLVGQQNERMQRYVEARAIPEEASKVYLMEVK